MNFLLLGTVNLTGGEYNIDVRVVDVGTGQLYSTAGVTKLSGQTYRDMMPKLANELATKLPQAVNATVTVIPAPEKPKSNSVVTLLGYLQVSPDDIGEFSSVPTNIIANINRQELYGYGDWRLPTQEELDLMKANSSKVGLKNGDYMTSTGRFGNVRLVTTGKTVKEKEAEGSRGILINGVRWATYNVGTRGQFVSSSEKYGNYYTWEESKTVCPAGWRLPTGAEIDLLISAGSIWTNVNGVKGRIFGSGNNTIFLPASGMGGFADDEVGRYWSSTPSNVDAKFLWFNNQQVNNAANNGGRICVRCVKAE